MSVKKTTKKPKCSVVIRSFNEERHICRLLTGILQQTIKDDVEIVLVDSGSTDATLAIASFFPVKVVSIPSSEFTFGRSLNIGCDAAAGDILVFISAHCYPLYEDWLEKMLEPFEDDSIAIVYGKQRGNETTRFAEHRVFEKWFPNESVHYQDNPFCNNANSAVRKSVWKDFPYDETLTGLEDLDFAKRTMAKGHRLAYQAEAEIIHVHDETWTQVRTRYLREAMALKRVFPEERFPFTDFMRHFVSNTVNDLVSASRKNVFAKEWLEIILFRFNQFFGTWRGYNTRNQMSQALRQSFYFSHAPYHVAEGEESQSATAGGQKMIDYTTQRLFKD